MDDRWQRISKLFHSALEREEDQRASYLRDACPGDDTLRHEVESLLGRETIPTRVLSTSAVDVKIAGSPSVIRPLSIETWSHFTLIERIGSGGFGEVYRAHDTKLDRDVALKLLPLPVSSNVADSLREARMLARIRHPHVVTVFGADQIDDWVGIWMEYVEGCTLEHLVQTQGPFGAYETALVGLNLCAALAAVHAAGVLHGDIKTRNVMREAGGRLLLMDFGAGQDFRNDVSHGGRLVGTPLYMAPELFNGQEHTKRVDIYALGVLLYYLVSRSYPVEGSNIETIIEAHDRRERHYIRDLRPELPQAFVRIIEHAIAPNPEDRISSAAAFEEELARFLSRYDDSLKRRQPTERPHIDDATTRAFESLRECVRASDRVLTLDEQGRHLVLHHAPRTADEYRLARIAVWSQPRWAIDKRFTPFTLLRDRGANADGARWDVQRSFNDLRDVLKETVDVAPALVLLGPPGSGKSTLLRRLEFDLACDAVRAMISPESWTWFVSLNRYRARRSGDPLPLPAAWLAEQWAADYPHLLPFEEVSRTGRFVLLLDALNEMAHSGHEDYHSRLLLWREFIADFTRRAPASRIVFSCRSLDYSENLSTGELTVPHLRIERLSDEQVRSFLSVYSPEHGAAIWARLQRTPQVDLYRSPYFLKLLLSQVGPAGQLPQNAAALFTGFVREALARENTNEHPLFEAGGLFGSRELARIATRQWRNAYHLPAGPLIDALSSLAFDFQKKRGGGSQVRAPLDEALLVLGGKEPERLVEAGVALQVLEDDRPRDEVLFVHQLLQEYFAARTVAATPAVSLPKIGRLVGTAWRTAEVPPPQFKSDSDPLPPAAQTGWEETFVLATAMASSADEFVSALMDANLPLAGRCAAVPEITLPPERHAALQRALIDRSRNTQADLRARIAAARALGEIGDQRFERRTGPFGKYLWPPFVEIPGGTYAIGSDDGDPDERPVHNVSIVSFAIGRFPVTNAEWRLFMDAGGYDDERWWVTEASKRWRKGDTTADGPRARQYDLRKFFNSHPQTLAQWLREDRITSTYANEWASRISMADVEFEALVEQLCPSRRLIQPARWNDPAFNHPSQPIVGICWFEACAYCAWLAAQSERSIRLPSEEEWESAARGKESRQFAWGNDFDSSRFNSFETHVRATTPIGVFPGGDTPRVPGVGVADMGNVWEWTNSAYKPYSEDGTEGREPANSTNSRRVLRGGSWTYYHRARATSRFLFDPVFRDDYIGCRVACDCHNF